MTEKFNLVTILKEIKEDDAILKNRPKREISQEEIKEMVSTKKKKKAKK